MQRECATSALRQIRTLYTVGTLGALSDAQLLELFQKANGAAAQDAFSALVDRHGPMVLGVCQRMLRNTHDAEDAFQAAFLVLARRAASIGRREKLSGWLHGVAVRTASEAKRRTARQRKRERRVMEMSNQESAPADDRHDLLPILDEELNRLPHRFRAALVACELEGKSRREAAAQLGLAEGTLSTHLARGRKLLRERLTRRGVSPAIGPALCLRQDRLLAAISERLMDSTVQAALEFASASSAAGTAPAAASLAERVIKVMVLCKLSLVLSVVMAAVTAAVCLGSIATATGGAVLETQSGPNDLSGRVVDSSGAPAVGAQVWAVAGDWAERVTVTSAKTDGNGRFVLPKVWDNEAAKAAFAAGKFGLFARASDGRPGWLSVLERSGAGGEEKKIEITLSEVGEARGHLTDKNGKPLKGVFVTPLWFGRPGQSRTEDSFFLASEALAAYRDQTAEDGSFVLKNVPRGARIRAAIEAPGPGWLHVLWDSSQPVTITNRGRVGQIIGRLKMPEGGVIRAKISVVAFLAETLGVPIPGSYKAIFSERVDVGADGWFLLEGLPPGRYHVVFQSDQSVPFVPEPVDDVDVGPDAVVKLEVGVARLFMITGRVVDAVTGKGVAKVPVHCYRLDHQGFVKASRVAETDTNGRYSIATAPGLVKVLPDGLAGARLVPRFADAPDLQVMGDQAWPDLKLVRATDLDGIVVDEKGKPVAGAQVYLLEVDRAGARRKDDRLQTDSGGAFHLDLLDPEEDLALWARTKLATSKGAVVVRPRNVPGKLTITIDPSFACQIRGMATDSAGKRVAGAKVRLWWGRAYAFEVGAERDQTYPTILEEYTTTENGWFIFRGLWPGSHYGTEVHAWAHSAAEAHVAVGNSGETLDVGKIVLPSTSGRLTGHVVGTDGQPVSGATVFNRGDGAELVATVTDSQGQFQLGSLLPGTKYAFIRKDGYRFTGVLADDDARGLRITLQKTSEPPPEWKPAASASFEDQRAFAKQILIKVWAKYGGNPDRQWTFECISAMAPIDLPLASEWSAAAGHQYDSVLHHTVAQKLAETDARGVLALLAGDQNPATQSFLQKLAQRFAGRDRARSLLFANEAIARARALGENGRPAALAAAGALMVRLGQAKAGLALIDEAAAAAEQLGTEDFAAQSRAHVANTLARTDLKRALALVEPIETDDKDRYVAFVARAIAITDTPRALALADEMTGRWHVHERVRSAIAYKIGAAKPDEAIRIIEDMKSEDARRWQAEAFAWLAVTLAPHNRARAFALIDRALAMLTDDSAPAATRGDAGDENMVAAAHIAARARQIGYPDMESVVMRVMAARPAGLAPGSERQIRPTVLGTLTLALLDPGMAETALKQIEARLGSGAFNPAKLAGARGPWLSAWSLVDIKKAETVFEAELAAAPGTDDPDALIQGILTTAKLLATPPERREIALQDGLYAGSWRPAQAQE